MSNLNKYIFYQTNKSVGICHIGNWNSWKYEKELTPIRISILECSKQYIDMLYDCLNENRQCFVDMVIDEINKDLFQIISN